MIIVLTSPGIVNVRELTIFTIIIRCILREIYDPIMKDIRLGECIAFQDIFWHNGVYSPFEAIEEPSSYFALAMLGEIGTLLNAHMKASRSPNYYSKEIVDDCADIFVCLLLLLLTEQRAGPSRIFDALEAEWDKQGSFLIASSFDFSNSVFRLIAHVEELARYEVEHTNPPSDLIVSIFNNLKAITFYLTGKSWQSIINSFHELVFQRHTDFQHFTSDTWYRGSALLRFDLLIQWAKRNELYIPPKRMMFLERMALLQEVNTQGLSRPGVDYVGTVAAHYCFDESGRLLMYENVDKYNGDAVVWDPGAFKVRSDEKAENSVLNEVERLFGVKGSIMHRLGPATMVRKDRGTLTRWLGFAYVVKVKFTEVEEASIATGRKIGWFSLSQLPQNVHSLFSEYIVKTSQLKYLSSIV